MIQSCLLPTSEAIRAEQSKRSLSRFIRHGWHVLEPGTPLEWNWHIDAIAEHLQAAFLGWLKRQSDPDYPQPIQNLVINLPPGFGKSRVCSVMFPAWAWLHCPSWRAIFLSSNIRVCLRDSIYCRDLIESDWYKSWFNPNWRLASDQNAKSLFRNTAGGFRLAIPFGGRITGDRADMVLWDDPHDAQEVMSEAKREEVIERYDSAIGNRVNDLRTSLRIGVMQRVHVRDLAGHVLEQGWNHLCLPMEFETTRACQCPECQRGETVIGWRDPRTLDGELLFPARFPPEVLAVERKRLGAYGYAGQMQQRPIPEGGAFFDRAWFRIEPAAPRRFKKLVRYWDIAAAAPGKGDWTVGVLMGEALREDGGAFWILHADRFQKGPDERNKGILQRTELDRQRYGSVRTYVEQPPGLGKEAVDTIIRLLAGYGAEADPVHRDKETRAEPFRAQAMASNVRMLADATWNADTLDVLATFPNAPHDDDVDGCSGAFNKLAIGSAFTPASSGAMGHLAPGYREPGSRDNGQQAYLP